MREILLVATLLGAALTVYGLLRALIEARVEADKATKRIDVMRALSEEERRAHQAVNARNDADHSVDMSSENERINQEFERRYAEHDLMRPSYNGLVYLAVFESQRLMSLVLKSSRRDFMVAIIGVVISTFASAASLYLA